MVIVFRGEGIPPENPFAVPRERVGVPATANRLVADAEIVVLYSPGGVSQNDDDDGFGMHRTLVEGCDGRSSILHIHSRHAGDILDDDATASAPTTRTV
ncbi:CRAL/TRIO domain-containing protein [Anopheles sinensis]|uniref:CRAL/TRIO domain-containing protein n=1 Tax=Anopheles sinensis TaxID=74873 RepID=A0A084WAY7_ANOSI|nr:CRAL/TRIO domain-containing protein [Anopheles sinensis]